jgi:hypothetical protein
MRGSMTVGSTHDFTCDAVTPMTHYETPSRHASPHQRKTRLGGAGWIANIGLASSNATSHIG